PESIAGVDAAAGISTASASPDAAPSALPSPAEIARVAESFAGAGEARAWVASHPEAWVLRFDTDANMAVGFAPWGPFAAAAAPLPGSEAQVDAFARRSQLIVDAASAPIWPIDELRRDGAIAIGRDLHRHEFARARIDELRELGVPVLCVETGWPDARSGYADLASY